MRNSAPHRNTKSTLKMSHSFDFGPLLLALEEVKPDDYVYGAVNAPGFVLPLAAFGVIAIAAVPFLLAPGEEALEQQRLDEQTKGAGFNSRKDKDLR
jgi:hypothetical protein